MISTGAHIVNSLNIFKAWESTKTDHKMFGDRRTFKQNYLKILRRKLAS